MLTYHSRKVARQLLYPLILFVLLPAYATASCSHSISYNLIHGTHTDLLGKVDPGLTDLADRIVSEYPEYCNMNIRIEFHAPFFSRQLVHKKHKENQHFFKVSYKAPEYSVTIQNSSGEVIHHKKFVQEWASVLYPQGAAVGSKEALYEQWQEQRNSFYKDLEETYNNYVDLKDFLYSLMPAESAVASADSSFTPKVVPYDPPEVVNTEKGIISRLMILSEEESFPDVIHTMVLPNRSAPVFLPLRPKDTLYDQ